MRIYWSGTAYWLEADLELRRSSGNRLSVDEALKRFDACCLPAYRGWEPDAFVAKLDALVGGDVFRRTFDAYRARRDFPDLAPTYRALGIVRNGAKLAFDEDAGDAGVRRAIMASRDRR
jgi:predicted metalloprotease with PDZ domain